MNVIVLLYYWIIDMWLVINAENAIGKPNSNSCLVCLHCYTIIIFIWSKFNQLRGHFEVAMNTITIYYYGFALLTKTLGVFPCLLQVFRWRTWQHPKVCLVKLTLFFHFFLFCSVDCLINLGLSLFCLLLCSTVGWIHTRWWFFISYPWISSVEPHSSTC